MFTANDAILMISRAGRMTPTKDWVPELVVRYHVCFYIVAWRVIVALQEQEQAAWVVAITVTRVARPC
jgi:hypothetical protein